MQTVGDSLTYVANSDSLQQFTVIFQAIMIFIGFLIGKRGKK